VVEKVDRFVCKSFKVTRVNITKTGAQLTKLSQRSLALPVMECQIIRDNNVEND